MMGDSLSIHTMLVSWGMRNSGLCFAVDNSYFKAYFESQISTVGRVRVLSQASHPRGLPPADFPKQLTATRHVSRCSGMR